MMFQLRSHHISSNMAYIRKKNIVLEVIIAVLVLAFCEWFFFRNVIGTGRGALISDRADGRLTNLLTEHWWNFFNGREKFSEIAMFYPQKEVIGYTDLFLGYGIVHSILRLAGLNMFVSYKWTVVLTHVLGTVSMYYLLKKKLIINTLWSLFGTIAFCFSDTLARNLGHTQLGAVAYLPLLCIFIIGFIDNIKIRHRKNIYAYCLIGWFVLLTYNSWYIACFTGFFGLLFLVVYCICLKRRGIIIISLLVQTVSTIGKDIIGYVIVLGLLYIPFIRIYIPVMKLSAGYSYDMCTAFLPEFADLINVTESNYMLGWLIKSFQLRTRGYSSEVEEGFSIVLLFMFFLTWVLFYKRKSIIENKRREVYKSEIISAAYISVVVGVLCVIRLSSNGVSLWYLAYTFVPVVRSMRAIARFLLWLSFPMSVVTAYVANKYLLFDRRYLQKFVPAISVVLVFWSNINKEGVSHGWNYPDELVFISDVSEPPADVECFYIIDSERTGDDWHIYQLDAFEIATVYSLKTINGYSGQIPDGWEGILNVCSDGYEKSVFKWIEEYKLRNVYAYDRARNTWIPVNERYVENMDDVFYPAENKYSISMGLEDWEQGEFAWTSKEFETHICNSKIKESGLKIHMRMQRSNCLAQNPDLKPYVHIYIDGELAEDVEVTDEYVELSIPMQDHDNDVYDVQIKTNGYFNPAELGQSSDGRDLSLQLFYIGA